MPIWRRDRSPTPYISSIARCRARAPRPFGVAVRILPDLCDGTMPRADTEAFLVCLEDTARSQGWAGVSILSTIERHNAFPDDPIQFRGGWAMDVDEFWAMGGGRPD